MQIFWSKTGDTVSVEEDNHELVDYWLNSLSADSKKQFHPIYTHFPTQIDQNVEKLLNNISIINPYLEKFKIDTFVAPTSVAEIIASRTLNDFHRHWTFLAEKQNIVSLFSKLYPSELKTFLDINNLIHAIEKNNLLAFSVDGYNLWRTKNIFGNSILKFGSWNVILGFANLGKTYYDKWWLYDTNFVDHDTNNYTNFGGILEIHLSRPYIENPPQQYLTFCKENQIEPLGNVVPIGNFKEEIDKAKEIFYNNSKIENNYIQLEKD